MDLLELVKQNAKNNYKRIVLPEGLEERTLKAADEVIGEKIAQIILIGNREKVIESANKLGLKNIEKAEIFRKPILPLRFLNVYVDHNNY